MAKISINNPEFFEIIDETTNKKYYGCNQEWYKKTWQRMAGCGPTVATNVLLYMSKNPHTTKSESLEMMEKVWKHVTPTLKGVNTTNIFYKGLVSYAKLNNKFLNYDAIDVQQKKEIRPTFENVVEFIIASLEKDVPVTFLNLCNGDEKCLDKWHWVTLISIEYDKSLNSAVVEILDEGIKKTIDLYLWYNTTTLGGGFVSFYLGDNV